MKSILQENKECFFTGATEGLHKHHIMNAYNRNKSEEYGLWVWLRWDRHIADSPYPTPHNDADVDLYLKRLAQREFEKVHGSREDFLSIFGKNYLDLED